MTQPGQAWRGSDSGTTEKTKEEREQIRRFRVARNRRAREDTLRSLGLVKVRGALGGTYWE